jgi:DNA polymerase-3 subunit epsilon
LTRIAVIDFETTGISPAMGDRATEVAIVMMEGGRVVDRFQSLMNAGVRIPSFITQLTGITNAMVAARRRRAGDGRGRPLCGRCAHGRAQRFV